MYGKGHLEIRKMKIRHKIFNMVNGCFIILNSIRDNRTMDKLKICLHGQTQNLFAWIDTKPVCMDRHKTCLPCLLLSTGFWILVQQSQNPEIFLC